MFVFSEEVRVLQAKVHKKLSNVHVTIWMSLGRRSPPLPLHHYGADRRRFVLSGATFELWSVRLMLVVCLSDVVFDCSRVFEQFFRNALDTSGTEFLSQLEC